jgi:hypothetical protein
MLPRFGDPPNGGVLNEKVSGAELPVVVVTLRATVCAVFACRWMKVCPVV